MRFFRLKHLTWWELAKRFWKKFDQDSVLDIAAQLSYYFLFSLFPLLFFLVTLLAYLPIPPGLVEALLSRAHRVMPGDALGVVDAHFKSLVSQPRPQLLTVGFAIALWSASRGLDALRKALNMAYDVTERRPFWKTQGLAILMTVVGTMLLPVAFVIFLLGGKLGAWAADKLHLIDSFHFFWSVLRWPFTAVIIMLVLALCYYVLPDVKQRFKYITPGSVFSAALWILSTWIFTAYVDAFGSYNVTYGSIAGVMVLLLWLYLTGLIFIVGGELNAILEHASVEGKAKGARAEGEPAREGPPVTLASAKSASSAREQEKTFWPWKRRHPPADPK